MPHSLSASRRDIPEHIAPECCCLTYGLAVFAGGPSLVTWVVKNDEVLNASAIVVGLIIYFMLWQSLSRFAQRT